MILHTIFCKYFEDMGEAQGFYEVVNGKLKFITGWFMSDAHYRNEYMGGLLKHLGAVVQDLPNKYNAQATKLFKRAYGL